MKLPESSRVARWSTGIRLRPDPPETLTSTRRRSPTSVCTYSIERDMRFRDEPPVVKFLALCTFTVVGALLWYLLALMWNNPPTTTVSEGPTIEVNTITGKVINVSEDSFLFITLKERVPLFMHGDRIITGALLKNRVDSRCFIRTWPVTGNPTFIPTDCPEQQPLTW